MVTLTKVVFSIAVALLAYSFAEWAGARTDQAVERAFSRMVGR